MMKDSNAPPPPKPYDEIEDAIDLAKKDPTKSWDDLLRKPEKDKTIGDKDKTEEGPSQKDERAAAAAGGRNETRRLYRCL